MKAKSVRIRFMAMAVALATLMTGFLGSCHTHSSNEADTVPTTDRESDSCAFIINMDDGVERTFRVR